MIPLLYTAPEIYKPTLLFKNICIDDKVINLPQIWQIQNLGYWLSVKDKQKDEKEYKHSS